MPMFLAMVSWVAMKVTDTAVLGHVGREPTPRYLDASALSDLWTICMSWHPLAEPVGRTASSGVFIQSRVVSTFCGQAYGAGNKALVGIWLQVSYVVLGCVMVPVAVCWLLTGPEVADASYYALVLAICLPVRIGFSQLNCFFNAQKIMRPSVVCSTIGMLLNLVGNLILVLGLTVPNWTGFGFPACPWVTTTVEFLQLFILWFIYCRTLRLHSECWPGWSWDWPARDRVVQYVKMYLPAALSIGSDFWRRSAAEFSEEVTEVDGVSVIGTIASEVGPDDLAVFNASYRICWMALTFLGALAGGVGVQLNIALGKGSTADAKHAAWVGTMMAIVVLVVLGVLILCIPRSLARIFSNDPKVLDLFESCRWPFAAFAVLMNLSVNIEKIPMAAGRVNSVFYAGLAGSWLGQVPGVILCISLWRKDWTSSKALFFA
eukprot:g31880.t1